MNTIKDYRVYFENDQPTYYVEINCQFLSECNEILKDFLINKQKLITSHRNRKNIDFFGCELIAEQNLDKSFFGFFEKRKRVYSFKIMPNISKYQFKIDMPKKNTLKLAE